MIRSKIVKIRSEKIAKIRNGTKYTILGDKTKKVIDLILDCILYSPQGYCIKSNRTLSKESGASVTIANRARRWLINNNFLDKFDIPNGNRINTKFLLMLPGSKFPKKFKLSDEVLAKFRYIDSTLLAGEELDPDIIANFDYDEFYFYEERTITARTKPDLLEKELIRLEALSVNESLQSSITMKNLHCIPTVEVEGKDKSNAVSEPCLGSTALRYNLLDRLSKFSNFSEFSASKVDLLNSAVDLEAGGFVCDIGYSKQSKRKLGFLKTLGHGGRIDMISKGLGEFSNSMLGNQLKVVLRKDMVCIDFDQKDESLFNFITKTLPECLATLTPRGYHVFFHDPSGILKNISSITDKIEVLHANKSVVFNDLGNNYAVIFGSVQDIGECDEKFLHNIEQFLQEDLRPMCEDDHSPTKFVLSNRIEDGLRNITLTKLGYSLRALGYTSEVRSNVLTKINRERCFPPVEKSQLRSIIRHTNKRPHRSSFVPKYKPDSKNFMPAGM